MRKAVEKSRVRSPYHSTRKLHADRWMLYGLSITTGRLKVGTTIETTYVGERHEAEVSADGGVFYQGKTYRSLSTTGEAVKFAVRGPGLPDSSRATDGWKFWHTVDPATGHAPRDPPQGGAGDQVGGRTCPVDVHSPASFIEPPARRTTYGPLRAVPEH
jgi:hypothetical protein